MLIDPSEFIGTQGITHLCTGGESPMLKTHGDAVHRFFEDKLLGEEGRRRLEVVSAECKEKVGRLFGVRPDDIGFLTSTSEGINLLVYALDWKPGDNVVVADVEFPSDVLPWTLLKDRGVELRIVENNNWRTDLEDLDQAIDENTRVVNVSHVSYFTGQRLPLPELSELVHRKNALLCLDVTHSAGAVPVEAQYADFVVSSCYKWLMAVHGVGIFYWNRERVPELNPPFVGWHTPAYLPDWKDPSAYVPREDASRFTPGNETWIGVYILDNALDCLLDIGIDRIEEHVLRPEHPRVGWPGGHGLGSHHAPGAGRTGGKRLLHRVGRQRGDPRPRGPERADLRCVRRRGQGPRVHPFLQYGPGRGPVPRSHAGDPGDPSGVQTRQRLQQGGRGGRKLTPENRIEKTALSYTPTTHETVMQIHGF